MRGQRFRRYIRNRQGGFRRWVRRNPRGDMYFGEERYVNTEYEDMQEQEQRLIEDGFVLVDEISDSGEESSYELDEETEDSNTKNSDYPKVPSEQALDKPAITTDRMRESTHSSSIPHLS